MDANLYESISPGLSVKVKLDLFHAIARLTRMFKKKGVNSKLKSKALEALSTCFRQKGDKKGKRTMPTPAKEEMEENLTEWYALYKDQDLWRNREGDTIGTELRKLFVHVRNDCLSGIPPRAGTSKNELIHRHCNRRLYKEHVSPRLIHCIMTVYIHQYNLKIAKKHGLDISSPAFFVLFLMIDSECGQRKYIYIYIGIFFFI